MSAKGTEEDFDQDRAEIIDELVDLGKKAKYTGDGVSDAIYNVGIALCYMIWKQSEESRLQISGEED